MKFYKLTVSYDGTDYQGWQAQKDVPTITNKLQDIFKQVFAEQVSIIGASRTDAGVHALNQIARAKTNLSITPEKLLNAWNNKLPGDIVIRAIEETDENFHPLQNVLEKIYFYNIFIEKPLPFTQRYGFYCHWPLNLEKLQNCLNLFVGNHDFRSFCTGYEMESTIRTIDEISLNHIPELNIYRVTFKGKSFLHHMIRRIVGACLDVSTKKNLDFEYLKEVLSEKNPEQTLLNAPAKGLMLYKIKYENED